MGMAVLQRILQEAPDRLRSYKGSPYEGGVRVANFCIWPERISAGQIVSSPVWIGDFAKTFLDAAGVDSAGLDGASIEPAIDANATITRPWSRYGGGKWFIPFLQVGRAPTGSPDGSLYAGQVALVSDWRKYIRRVYWGESFQRIPVIIEEFYDLRKDLGELTNRIDHPAYQAQIDLCRSRYSTFDLDERFEENLSLRLTITPPDVSVWANYIKTRDLGFQDDTNVLETTLTP